LRRNGQAYIALNPEQIKSDKITTARSMRARPIFVIELSLQQFGDMTANMKMHSLVFSFHAISTPPLKECKSGADTAANG
jgi:hypothetical protein